MKKVIWAIITGALFGGLIAMLGRFDVAATGSAGTEIGFSHINQLVHDLTGVNMMWYEITEYIGYAAIGVCGLFAMTGFVQMIKRRSLLKVDREIWALGGLFVAVIACYIFFEKNIINYRPVIMPGETAPEASFPSSHTMLIMTVMVAVMIISDKYFRKELGVLVRIVCFAVTVTAVGGRLYCGVHWFTDIIGGVLLSATLLLLFSAVAAPCRGRKAKAADEKASLAAEMAYDPAEEPGSAYGDEVLGRRKRADVREKGKASDGYIPKH